MSIHNSCKRESDLAVWPSAETSHVSLYTLHQRYINVICIKSHNALRFQGPKSCVFNMPLPKLSLASDLS